MFDAAFVRSLEERITETSRELDEVEGWDRHREIRLNARLDALNDVRRQIETDLRHG